MIFILCIKFFVAITASFEHSVYRVREGTVRDVTPKLELSRPSPCCITIHCELKDITAIGELCVCRNRYLMITNGVEL